MLSKFLHNRERKFYKIGQILGFLRFYGGYIGKTRSKKSYINTISKSLNSDDKKKVAKILNAFWINHQKGFVELFISRKFNKENIDNYIKFEGLNILEKALSKKKGVVLAVPHFGNERLIHIGLALKGFPVTVITSKFENTTQLVRDIKLGAFIKIHPVGYPTDSPRWMYNTLKKNKILQISPPADEGPGGHKIKFLNHQILVSKTPARLAYNSGAALIPAFDFRNYDDTHTVVINPEIDFTSTSDKKKDIINITSKLMQKFEINIHKHPEQFYWMWLMIKNDEAQKFILKGENNEFLFRQSSF